MCTRLIIRIGASRFPTLETGYIVAAPNASVREQMRDRTSDQR
jgi:hypothetical protein